MSDETRARENPALPVIHIDWAGCSPWRKRLGAWAQWHSVVTLGRLLGAKVEMADGR